MDDSKQQTSLINRSAEVVEKSSDIVAALQTHVDANCIHCTELLKEIFDNSLGVRPMTSRTPQKNITAGTNHDDRDRIH